jgi:hypothetical protein
LIASVDHDAAYVSISNREDAFEQLLNDATTIAVKAGIKHLTYLKENWMQVDMWRSWSERGRIQASATIGIPVEGVVPTTNHLESFNAILKRKHLPAWLHSGHRLRFDSLIHILITRVLPSIFSQRKAQKEYSDWLTARFCQHAGGRDLTSIKDIGSRTKSHNTICWWQPDARRDGEAGMILHLPNRFSVARGPDPHNSYRATCASSKANILDANHLRYTINIHRCGISSCTCLDFIHGNGLACKHLRVLRSLIVHWIQGHTEQEFCFPSTSLQAQEIAREFSIVVPLAPTDTAHVAPLVPPPAVQIDWSVIQALGNDTTTLDENEAPQIDAGNNGEQSEDSQDALTDCMPLDVGKQHQEVQQYFKFKTSKSITVYHSQVDNRSTIVQQVQRRVEYEINRLLPALYGIENLIIDTPELSRTATVDELVLVTQSLTLALQRLGSTKRTDHTPEALPLPLPTPVSAQTQGYLQKRGRHHSLLAPSPERRQKRKDSHAPL